MGKLCDVLFLGVCIIESSKPCISLYVLPVINSSIFCVYNICVYTYVIYVCMMHICMLHMHIRIPSNHLKLHVPTTVYSLAIRLFYVAMSVSKINVYNLYTFIFIYTLNRIYTVANMLVLC